MTSTDADADDADNAFTSLSTAGTLGTFEIDASGAWTFTANSAFDELDAGDSYTETFDVTSVDGTSSTVDITIVGTNDAASVSTGDETLVETDAAVSTSGTLTSTDADADDADNAFTSLSTAGTLGTFDPPSRPGALDVYGEKVRLMNWMRGDSYTEDLLM